MLKIIKWGAIGVVGLGAAGFFLFGENAFSYVGTMASSVKDSVRGQIPIEFELKRAERLIGDINPQIKECKRDVARQEVRLDNLVEEVELLERQVARAERKLKSGADLLANSEGQTTYVFASGEYGRERVQIDLERTFDSYRHNTALLKSKQALIKRQRAAVEAARSKLDAVCAEEARLNDLVGQLKTQKAQIDAMAASSKGFELDDSALGKAKEVLAEVEERLDVAQKMLADELFFENGISGEHRPQRNIVREIREHFTQETADEGRASAAPAETALIVR